MKQVDKIKRIWGVSIAIANAQFKLKNENSYLGVLWYIINPLIMFYLLLSIFQDRLGGKIPNYPVYLIIGIIMFNLFSKITSKSTTIIYSNKIAIQSLQEDNIYVIVITDELLYKSYRNYFEFMWNSI